MPILGGLLLLLISGILSAIALFPDGRRGQNGTLWLMLLALALGFGMVPLLSFLIFYVLLGVPVSPFSVVGAGVVLVLWSFMFAGARGSRFGTWVELLRDLKQYYRHSSHVLKVALLLSFVYLFAFDASQFQVAHGCFHRAGLASIGSDMVGPVDLMRDVFADARLGNAAVLSAYLALFSDMGFRVLYGLVGFLLALGGYLYAWELSGKRTVFGYVGMLFIALNPAILKIPLLDENMLALGFLATIFPWLTRKESPWIVLGILFSLVLGMRHILVLSLPGILFIVWRVAGKRSFLWFFLAMFAGTLPWHWHHHLALGSVFRFESFGQVGQFVHSIGPFSFNWEGMLGWPFVEQLIRTPQNPFPTMFMWPLWLMDHFGLLLFSAVLLGVAVGSGRRHGIFALLFFLPVFGILSVQENWDYVHKMTVIVILMLPMLFWLIRGLLAITARPKMFGPILLGIATLMFIAAGLVRPLETTADERYVKSYPLSASEPRGLIDYRKETITDSAPWPDFGRLNDYQEFFVAGKAMSFLRQLITPGRMSRRMPFGWHLRPAVSGSTTVELDLSREPWGRVPIKPGDGPPDIDLTTLDGPALVGPILTSWTETPVFLMATGSDTVLPALLILPGDRGSSKDLHYLISLMQGRVGGMEDSATATVLEPENTDGRLVVKFRGSGMNLFLRLNIHAYRFLMWRVDAKDDEICTEPRWVYHD